MHVALSDNQMYLLFLVVFFLIYHFYIFLAILTILCIRPEERIKELKGVVTFMSTDQQST